MTELPTNGLSMDTYEVTRLIRRSGFEYFSEFPPHITSRVCKLLALGVIIHSHNRSSAISQWLQQHWKPRVSSIITFASNFSDVYQDPCFWSNVPAYLNSIVVDIGGQLPNEMDATNTSLRKLCEYLCFDVFLLRKRSGNWEIEVIRAENEIGLPIVIGEEAGSLLFLYHPSQFSSEESASFPLYFLPPKDRLVFSGFTYHTPSWTEVTDTSHTMIDTVLTYILQFKHQYQSSESFEGLKQVCAEYAVYAETMGLPMLKSVEEVRHMEVNSDERHELGLCGQFRLVDTYVTVPGCGHRFHETCLRLHLQTYTGGNCRCPICSGPIPSDFPSRAIEIPDWNQSSEPYSPALASCYCSKCGEIRSFRQVQNHSGHYVCVRCLYGFEQCPVCGVPLSPQETLWAHQATDLLTLRF